MIKLGLNIDHVATLRQARRVSYPNLIRAALMGEQAGADAITLHLREDRRHIQDQDVFQLRQMLQTRMNLESAVTSEMIEIALQVKPHDICLVPEKREEITTEGGLDVVQHFSAVQQACRQCAEAGIRVSLFIDPETEQLDAAHEAGAPVIELHTGTYADAVNIYQQRQELERLHRAAVYAHDKGLQVNAGHGLHYYNVTPIVNLPHLAELNIGHAIIAEAVFIGLEAAVSKMRQLMQRTDL